MDIGTLKKTIRVGQVLKWSPAGKTLKSQNYDVLEVRKTGALLKPPVGDPFQYDWSDFSGDIKANFKWTLAHEIIEIEPDTIII